jgi:hypothetical protein
MNFNFGEVLSRAWQIIWKHKVLWIFGIFAGCARGGGGGGGGAGGSRPGGNQSFPQLQRTLEQFAQWVGDHPWVVVLFVVLVVVLIVISIFLGTIGRIGLIRGTYQAEQGAERLVFGELFSGSTPYFWRVLGLALLVGLIGFLIFIPFLLFGVLTAGIGFVCLLPLLCILIPVLWAVSVVIEQANVAIVLENLGITDGLRRGWEVVRANAGPIILMALILFVGSAVVGFVLAIPVIAAVLPFVFGAASNSRGAILTGLLCFAAYLPVLIVLGGILTAYVQTAWALTYMRLTRPPENVPVIPEANA